MSILQAESVNLKAKFEKTAEKPVPLKPIMDGIPDTFKNNKVWLTWKYRKITDKQGNAKWTKVPTCTWDSAKPAKTSVPALWSSYEDAREAVEDLGGVEGPGIMLTHGLVGGDLDNCRNPETGEIKRWAREIIDQFNCYTEVSPSGTGVKMFFKGSFAELLKLPKFAGIESVKMLANRTKYHDGEVEFYDSSSPRWFAVTGRAIEGSSTDTGDRQGAFSSFYSDVFDAKVKAAKDQTKTRQKAREKAQAANPDRLPIGDKLILETAFSATNGRKIKRLWEGDTSDYRDDASSADLALCSHLAFYCGPDPAKIDTLFRQSGLYRPKWDREDYRERTLAKVIFREDFYNWKPRYERVRAAQNERLVAEKIRETKLRQEQPEQHQEQDELLVDPAEAEDNPTQHEATSDEIASCLQGWDELCEIADNQHEDWLVQGLMEFGCLHILSGLPFSGKSTVIAELIASIAKDTDFFTIPVQSCPVILVDLENKERILVKRIRASLAGDQGRIRERLFRVPPKVLDLPLTADDIRTFIGAIRKSIGDTRAQKGLIVIDTLRSAFSATEGFNENDPGFMNLLLKPLKDLAAETGFAILVIHHNAKGSGSYSGSTAIAGTADYLWNWVSDKEAMTAVLSVEGRDDFVSPMSFEYDPVTRRNEYKGVAKNKNAEKKQDKLDGEREVRLKCFPKAEERAITLKDYEKESKAATTTAERHVKDLHDLGFLERTGEGTRQSPFKFWVSEQGRIFIYKRTTGGDK